MPPATAALPITPQGREDATHSAWIARFVTSIINKDSGHVMGWLCWMLIVVGLMEKIKDTDTYVLCT